MNIWMRGGVLLLLVALSTTCADPPTAPTPAAPATTIAAAPPGVPMCNVTPGFPKVPPSARVYVNSQLYRGLGVSSRYVLYEGSAFALQFATAGGGFFEYRGTYKQSNAVIDFNWEASIPSAPWGAVGLLGDDALAIQYNAAMTLSDFEHGVYLLQC